MSIAIYRPYFYIIQHIESKKFYAGVKYSRDANPDNLLKSNGYQTSSKIIHQLILEEGLESFIIRKIKVFETGEEALAYESRFLRRVNASFNESFLNRSNSSLNSLNVDYKKRIKTNLERYGVEYISQSEEVKEKKKQTSFEKFGCGCILQATEIREQIKQTNLERYGHEYASQAEEVKEKKKQTFLERYGHECVLQSEEIREQIKQTFLERYGHEYASQAEEVKEKIKQTNLKRYGFVCSLQSEEIKEKKKQNFLIKYGVETPSQVPEFQEKKSQNFNITNNRPTVLLIRKYRDKFNLKLGSRWFWKPQEFLDGMLAELKINYGELK